MSIQDGKGGSLHEGSLGALEMDGRPEGKKNGGDDAEWTGAVNETPSCPITNITEFACISTGFCVALCCGTPNAWSLTGGDMQDDLDLTDSQINLITSFGLLGLFFTFFAGLLYDYVGVAPMVGIGCITTTGGYFVMSFGGQDSWLLILFAFMFVGFGSGGAFTSVLGFGLKSLSKNPGFAVATVGGGMSLSMAFVTVLFLILHSAACEGDCPSSIWRSNLRLLAVVAFCIEAPATVVLYYLDKKKKPISGLLVETELDNESTREKSNDWELRDGGAYSSDYRQEVSGLEEDDTLLVKQPQTFKEKLSVLQTYFFWVLFVAYAVGVGGCLIVLVEMVDIWDTFVENTPQDREGWIFPISLTFSLVNCFVGGILFGWVSDVLVARGLDRTKALSFIFIIFSLVFFALAGTLIPDVPPSSLQVIVMLLLISTGISFGTMVNTFPTLVGENYDMANFGLYLGLLQVGVAAATFLVPMLSTLDYNKTGSFFGVFCLFALLYLICGIVLFFVKPPSSS